MPAAFAEASAPALDGDAPDGVTAGTIGGVEERAAVGAPVDADQVLVVEGDARRRSTAERDDVKIGSGAVDATHEGDARAVRRHRRRVIAERAGSGERQCLAHAGSRREARDLPAANGVGTGRERLDEPFAVGRPADPRLLDIAAGRDAALAAIAEGEEHHVAGGAIDADERQRGCVERPGRIAIVCGMRDHPLRRPSGALGDVDIGRRGFAVVSRIGSHREGEARAVRAEGRIGFVGGSGGQRDEFHRRRCGVGVGGPRRERIHHHAKRSREPD